MLRPYIENSNQICPANLMEWFRDLTDKLILKFLHATSHFSKELSPKGWREQAHWRDQRLKNLQALSLRSKQAREAFKK